MLEFLIELYLNRNIYKRSLRRFTYFRIKKILRNIYIKNLIRV